MKLILILFAAIIAISVACFKPCREPLPDDSNFARGLKLICSRKWSKISNNLWWHTFEEYSDEFVGGFPYFMFTYCTTLSIDILIEIEVTDYFNASRCWISQLIKWKRLPDGTDRAVYKFFPFDNRVVYQRWEERVNDPIHQYYMYTTNQTDPKLITMVEDVHKFIYPDGDCNRVVYAGAEDPRGWMRPFPMEYFYAGFYWWHYFSQLECLKKYTEEPPINIIHPDLKDEV